MGSPGATVLLLKTKAETARRVMRLATVAKNRLRKHGPLPASKDGLAISCHYIPFKGIRSKMKLGGS